MSGTTYVFARGADHNVWYLTRDAASGRYGAWQRLSGIHVADDPAVVSARRGQLDLFALGTDGLLYRRTMTGGLWGQWYQVDERTRFDAAPAAASSEPGRIDLVGRTGGDLITASLVGDRWNAWALVPTAGRIAAAPGGRDYGRLSVVLQWRYDIEPLFDVPPAAFDPPPRVVSSVLRMVPWREPAAVDPALLSEIVAVAFSQRRKLLRHTLGRWLEQRSPVAPFDVQRRAEEVPVAEYVRLAQTIQRAGAR